MSEIRSSVSRGAGPLVETTNCSFALFQELPKELRLKIWKLALPGPRLIDIFADAPQLINSRRSIPSILHVCSESRKEALEWYTAIPLWRPFRTVYVNFQIDTLYFTPTDPKAWAPVCGWSGRSLKDDVRFVSMTQKAWGCPELAIWCVQRFAKLELFQRFQIDTLYFTSTDPDAWAPVWSWPGYGLKDNVRFVSMTQKAWGCPAFDMWFIQRYGKLEELTVVMFDVGTGEIADEYKLEMWDKRQIGDEVGVAIRTSEIPISSIKRECMEWIKWAVTMKENGNLKNMNAGLAAFQRAGPEAEITA